MPGILKKLLDYHKKRVDYTNLNKIKKRSTRLSGVFTIMVFVSLPFRARNSIYTTKKRR